MVWEKQQLMVFFKLLLMTLPNAWSLHQSNINPFGCTILLCRNSWWGKLGLINFKCLVQFSSNVADIALVFCDKPEKAKLLLESTEKGETSVLKTIVIMDTFDHDLVARGKRCGVDIISMKELEVSRTNSLSPVLLYMYCLHPRQGKAGTNQFSNPDLWPTEWRIKVRLCLKTEQLDSQQMVTLHNS